MTGDAVRQRLAEISERAEAASGGPWRAEPDTGAGRVWVQRYRQNWVHDCEPLFSFRDLRLNLSKEDERAEYAQRESDALFVAASRTDVPRLVAALTGTPEKPGVLDLHRFSEAENCCAECEQWWPCPTYRAVAAALEEQS